MKYSLFGLDMLIILPLVIYTSSFNFDYSIRL